MNKNLQTQAVIQNKAMQHRHVQKKDGRSLNLYGWETINSQCLEPKQEQETHTHFSQSSHMRWHPLRREWVIYSGARQGRTFKPSAAYCPLCPSKNENTLTEIPFNDFEIAVFDNKFPALHITPDQAPAPIFSDTSEAQGKCEVIVYTAEHNGNLGLLSQNRLELLIEVLIHRYKTLREQDDIKFVMPFENRGEEAGVTLHHPHGQIYAYNFIPPVIHKSVQAFRKTPVLTDFLQETDDQYIIFQDEWMSAYVPSFARYPYEIWISANRKVPGPWALSPQEKTSYAAMLQKTVQLYDRFFQRDCPYLHIIHAAPAGEDDYFEFSSQFYPLLRGPDKMKYLAGCEQGAGTFLNDVLPEKAAEQLRNTNTS